MSSTKFMFFGPIGKTKWTSWPLVGWDIFDWNRWSEFYETWQEAWSQRPLSSLWFSSRLEKQDGRPGLWFADTFSTSALKPLNGIQRNLTESKISMSSTKFVFFGPIGKTKWPSWPLIDLDIFDWNRWWEFNETLQEAWFQCPLPILCFSGRSEKQNGRPGLWLTETFSTSPLKLLYGIQRNFKGSIISMSSTKFVFFGPIGITRWPSWYLIGWHIFDFSSITAEWNSTKLHRKQECNVLYKVCVFGPMGKTRWPPWLLIGWDIFDFSFETAEGNSTKPYRKQDCNVPYKVCVFHANKYT